MRDDPDGPVDRCIRQHRLPRQRRHPPGRDPPLQRSLVLFGLDQRHLEVQAVLAGDLARHRRHQVQVRRPAGPAAGADHQRNSGRTAAFSISRRSRRMAIGEQNGLPDPR